MKMNEFKEAVIAAAKARNIEEYEFYGAKSDSINAGALMHAINEFSTETMEGVCFRCIANGRMGYASTELFTLEEAERIVDAALENAASIESEDKVFIHAPGDTYENIAPIDTVEPSAAKLIESVMSIHEKTYKADSRIIDGFQTFGSFDRSSITICNSKGLDLQYSDAYSQFGCEAVAKDGENMYNGFVMKAVDYAKLDEDAIVKEAVDDAIEQIGQESVNSGTYNIVLSGKMVASLLGVYFSIFTGESTQRGLSLLAGKEGEMIASDLVTLVDDPFCEDTFLRMPFDSEGVATYRKNIIEKGKLNTLLYNLATAHKAGVKSTGNGKKLTYSSSVNTLPYNLYLAKGGSGEKEDIFKAIGNGIYVTSLNGLHAGANPVTGDFSIASEGYLIENGKKSRPAKNFTISGNFYQLLKDIFMVGDDLKFSTPRSGCCFGSPTIAVKDVSVAGK